MTVVRLSKGGGIESFRGFDLQVVLGLKKLEVGVFLGEHVCCQYHRNSFRMGLRLFFLLINHFCAFHSRSTELNYCEHLFCCSPIKGEIEITGGIFICMLFWVLN